MHFTAIVSAASIICFWLTGIQCSFADDRVDFVSQIKPILSDNCYYCHGPDEAQRATELRLDTREAAFSDLGGYRAIVPGDVNSSELARRILSSDTDELMPPPDHRKKLTQRQKELLVLWIKQGAKWSEHWAFKPPVKSKSPVARDGSWPINFIDNYISAKLEQQKIEPSAIADRHIQLRRLSFDLIGLPPTLEELRRFIDDDDKAYENAVDRLLASPHFGERMAVYWLDLVRYADSVGYHGDQPISVSPYRDYVIDAFNRNMPFDQFTREQLAGDLLENPTRDQLIASGYNRLGMMSAEGGVQPEEYLNKYASDRVRTTASVWLGITLGCAECHDHKFDPISSAEFYAFSAFFADIKERGLYEGAHESRNWGPSIEVPDEILPELLEPIDRDIEALKHALVETPAIKRDRLAWETDIRGNKFDWRVLEPAAIQFVNDVNATITDEHSILVGGENPNENCYVVTAKLPDIKTRAIRLEVLPHPSLPKNGPGRAGNGNFVVTELFALRDDQSGEISDLKKVFDLWPEDLKSKSIRTLNPSATIEQTRGGQRHPDKKWSAASAIDHDNRGSTWGWAILPEVGKPNELVLQVESELSPNEKVTFVIQQYHGQGSHTLGHFRFSATNSENATSDPFHSLPPAIRTVIDIPRSERTDAQVKQISEYYTSIAPQFADTNKRLAELSQQRRQIVDQHTLTSLITVSVPPREIRVLPRGNWMDRSGPVVTPSVPQVLGGPNWQGVATRRELANWIVSKQNPLTARVFVNRIWRMFFGNGLSNVLDDFGSQGQPPSHPELLDRLAIEFMESGWNVKHLVRLIVSSQTYRQSSNSRKELAEIDPENRLLARQSRYRLDAEFVRDHALAVSGLLDKTIGGRSVKPYQPPGLYRHLNFPTRKYQASTGQDQYRRGVYTHWQRQYLHPAMKTFDAPAREECTAARPRSSTPLAALVLLNDPSYVEAAKSLATSALQQSGDRQQKLNWIFLRAFSRPISKAEIEVLSDLLDSHLEFFSNNPDQAKQLLRIGQNQWDKELSIERQAAWTSVCRVVMNMHEFVTRN